MKPRNRMSLMAKTSFMNILVMVHHMIQKYVISCLYKWLKTSFLLKNDRYVLNCGLKYRGYCPEQGPIDTQDCFPKQGTTDATINRHYLIRYWVDVMAYAHIDQLSPLCILIVVTTNWLIVILSMDYQSLGTIYASTMQTTDVPSQ